MLAVLAVHTALAFYIGNRGWDDGAITLAFARTYALTGKIALTPESVAVEGYSSPLWLLIFIGVQWVAHPGFDAVVRISQLLTGLCAAVSAGLFDRLIRHALPRPWLRACLSVLLFISAPFLNETMNGMEMSLLAMLVLVLALGVRAPEARPVVWVLGACAAAAAAVRFEAFLYLGIAAAGLWLGDRASAHRRRAALAVVAGAAVGALGTELMRIWTFHDVLPNTVWAKRWPPYHVEFADWSDMALARAYDVIELLRPCAFALLLLLAVATERGRRGCFRGAFQSQPSVAFAAAYVAAVVMFNIAVGRNWGYVGRMQLSAMPMLFYVLIASVRHGRTHQAARTALVWTAAAVVSCAYSALYIQRDHLHDARFARRDPSYFAGTTPASYRRTGEIADEVRRRLGLERLSVMAPDVGGLSLCCAHLDIIDSALLTDRVLARKGYAAFGDHLAARRADLIATHGLWSRMSGIYTVDSFLRDYRPIAIAGVWMYLRRDHADRLGWSTQMQPDAAAMVGRLRYLSEPVDTAFVRSRHDGYLPLPDGCALAIPPTCHVAP